jgi:polyhydroxyalkanoate synthesis regulator phasin
MADEQRRMPGIGEGLRAGIGILTAFKEAVEETFQDAVNRGDMKPDRASAAVQDAMRRAQEAFGDVRGRLDVVPRKEFDDLRSELESVRAELAELRTRMNSVEASGGDLDRGAGPDASGIIIDPL